MDELDGQFFGKIPKAFFSSLMGEDRFLFFQKSKFIKLVLVSTKARELTN